MQILAAADLHGNHDVYEWLIMVAGVHGPDVVVLAGDLLGFSDGYESVAAAQEVDRDLVLGYLAKFERPVIYLMGNDDWIELSAQSADQQSVHGRRVAHGAFNFIGYQYTLPFMGGINERPEEDIRADLAALEPELDEHTILVTHGPAHGIMDRGILDRHAGSLALSELANIHGHIHSEFGRQGRHFNVASGGQKRAMIIDVLTMRHKVLEDHALTSG